jgi:hypothetical protein
MIGVVELVLHVALIGEAPLFILVFHEALFYLAQYICVEIL